MNKYARSVRDAAGIPYSNALKFVTGQIAVVALNQDCLVLAAMRAAGCRPVDPQNPRKATCECAKCCPTRKGASK